MGKKDRWCEQKLEKRFLINAKIINISLKNLL